MRSPLALGRALRARFVAALSSSSKSKLDSATRPVVQELERRVLLSGAPVAMYHFDEGSGTNTADATGSASSGTLSTSGATWTTGQSGSALSLDGANGYATVPDSPSLHLPTAWTVSAWVMQSGLTGNYQTVLSKGGLLQRNYDLDTDPSGHVRLYMSQGHYVGFTGSTVLQPGVWYHLAGTYDGATMKLYVNGVLDTSLAASGTADTTSDYPSNVLGIGCLGDTLAYRWKGSIDEVRIYDEALTGTQIQSLASTDTATLPPSVHFSPDAAWTLTGSPGAYTLSVSSGTLSLDDDLSTEGSQWQGLQLTLSGSAHAYFNSRQTLANSDQTHGGLTLNDSSKVTVAQGGGGVNSNLLTVGSLSIDRFNGATLDLADNDLIWRNAGSYNLNGLTCEQYLQANLGFGLAGGTWTGAGLTSSVAAQHVGDHPAGQPNSNYTYALGYALNNGQCISTLSSFDGVSVTSNDVLVKYTLAGDANLDGQVDWNDGYAIDSGRTSFPAHRYSWAAGNLDYNAFVDSNDYIPFNYTFGLTMADPNLVRVFQPVGIVLTLPENTAWSGDIATFTDSAHPGIAPANYQAFVSWGAGFTIAQVTADSSHPGGYRINALSPNLPAGSTVVTITVQYAPGASDGSGNPLQGRPAAVSEPVAVFSAVEDLVATTASGSAIDLAWNTNVANISQIKIQRSPNSATWSDLVTIAPAMSYQDTGLSEGQTYYYRVQAIQPAGASAFTNTASAYTIASPTGLTLTPISDTQIDLSWSNPSTLSPGASVYISDDGVNYDKLADLPAGQTSYSATGLDPSKTYTFQIVNSNGSGASPPSAPASAHPTPIPTPTGLSATSASASQIHLAWSPAAGVAGYNLYRSTSPDLTPDASNLLDFGLTDTTYEDSGLDPATTYYYLVTAANTQGNESNPSTISSAATATAHLSATGANLSGQEGEDIEGLVATFTDTDVTATADDYTAQIDWGDGQSSDGTFTENDTGGYDIHADHAYGDVGDKTYTVTITHTASGRTATATGTTQVADAPLLVRGMYGTAYYQGNNNTWMVSAAFSPQNGQPPLASFSDDDPNAKMSDYTVSIDWGDGSAPSAGELFDGGVRFYVGGGHYYSSGGDYTATITVTDASGATASGQAHVACVGGPTPSTITNGTLTLHLTNFGSVADESGVFGNTPGFEYAGIDGLRSEQWGVADLVDGVSGGPSNSTVVAYTATATTATSTVNVGSNFQIRQAFVPSSNPSLYAASVQIENTTASPEHLVYRRVLQWGSTWATYKFVSLAGSSPAMTYSSDDGGDYADPLHPHSTADMYADGANIFRTGTFDTIGPGEADYPSNPGAIDVDLGASLEFDFGTLPAHAVQTFTLYYGAADSRSVASSALSSVGAEVTSFYQQADSNKQPVDSPTFAFGFKSGPQYTADLAADANNDGTINAADESIKDDSTKPGKVVIADTLDETGNHKPGYADLGSTGFSFAPVNFSLSNNIDVSKAILTFHYSSADPNLVKGIAYPNSSIQQYDPGSTGALRLWTTNTARNTTGDFLGDGQHVPAGTIFTGGSHTATLYAEGINPTDPQSTEVSVDIDVDGTGTNILHDAVRFTVADMRIVYTDVSGISHDTGDTSVTPVPRIPVSTEPDGVACDWLNGVDEGSLLLIRTVGSPALAMLFADAPSGQFTVQLGGVDASPGQFVSLDARDGFVHSDSDGFVPEAYSKLMDLNIETPGEAFTSTGLAAMTVLSEAFYRPPNEFDSSGYLAQQTERRVALGIQVTVGTDKLIQGAKPQGLILTRPPLVLVHGIDSNPWVWSDPKSGKTFIDAMKDEYAGIYTVDHSGADPNRPAEGPTFGTGEISDMYTFVRDEISTATSDYRIGKYFSASPYTAPDADGDLLSHALIAVQKVDVVAHSYGGLLTRWYIEQSPDYSSRRDVRKLVELGTPNKGSPLANMVDEVYRNPVIAAAEAKGFYAIFSEPMIDVLSELNKGTVILGKTAYLPTALPGGKVVREFYEDCSLGSAPLMSLASHPFNDDVAYGAVVGTNTGLYHYVDLFGTLQPMGERGLGTSYFPWISTFNSDPGSNDAIVPTWSAALGVAAYNHYVDEDHVDLVQNQTVQSTVLTWLNDPSLPLGSAQRAAYDPTIPVSQRNAYQGATSFDPATGHRTGGGLKPNAIVGVSFGRTGMGKATWDTTTIDDDGVHTPVGIQTPVLTGMIRVGDIGSASFTIVDLQRGVSNATSTLQNLGVVAFPDLHIDPAQLVGASPTDWVAFSVNLGRIGRRHDPLLTGPNGEGGPGANQSVAYQMADIPGGISPGTPIALPEFSLTSPIVSGLAVQVSGAVEATRSTSLSQTAEVDLYAKGWVFSTLLWQMQVNVPHPAGTWDGVLLPYHSSVGLFYDTDGNVAGTSGSSGSGSADIYQYLREQSGVSNGKSGTVHVQ